MLIELAEHTGLPRPLRARLIGVPLHSLRRWEDNTRTPDQAARRVIGLTCAAVAGLHGLEIIKVMIEQANAVAGDRSRSAAARVAASRSVAQLGLAMVGLSEEFSALGKEQETCEQVAA